MIVDFTAKLESIEKAEERHIGRYDTVNRMTEITEIITLVKANKLVVVQKKGEWKWVWIAPNVEIKKEIDCLLINAGRIMKDIFQHRKRPCMLRARIHITSPVQKGALNVSSQKEIVEEKLLRQVETTDWMMASGIEEDYLCFTKKLLQCVKRAERASLDNSRFEGIRSNQEADREEENLKKIIS